MREIFEAPQTFSIGSADDRGIAGAAYKNPVTVQKALWNELIKLRGVQGLIEEGSVSVIDRGKTVEIENRSRNVVTFPKLEALT